MRAQVIAMATSALTALYWRWTIQPHMNSTKKEEHKMATSCAITIIHILRWRSEHKYSYICVYRSGTRVWQKDGEREREKRRYAHFSFGCAFIFLGSAVTNYTDVPAWMLLPLSPWCNPLIPLCWKLAHFCSYEIHYKLRFQKTSQQYRRHVVLAIPEPQYFQRHSFLFFLLADV